MLRVEAPLASRGEGVVPELELDADEEEACFIIVTWPAPECSRSSSSSPAMRLLLTSMHKLLGTALPVVSGGGGVGRVEREFTVRGCEWASSIPYIRK